MDDENVTPAKNRLPTTTDQRLRAAEERRRQLEEYKLKKQQEKEAARQKSITKASIKAKGIVSKNDKVSNDIKKYDNQKSTGQDYRKKLTIPGSWKRIEKFSRYALRMYFSSLIRMDCQNIFLVFKNGNTVKKIQRLQRKQPNGPISFPKLLRLGTIETKKVILEAYLNHLKVKALQELLLQTRAAQIDRSEECDESISDYSVHEPSSPQPSPSSSSSIEDIATILPLNIDPIDAYPLAEEELAQQVDAITRRNVSKLNWTPPDRPTLVHAATAIPNDHPMKKIFLTDRLMERTTHTDLSKETSSQSTLELLTPTKKRPMADAEAEDGGSAVKFAILKSSKRVK